MPSSSSLCWDCWDERGTNSQSFEHDCFEASNDIVLQWLEPVEGEVQFWPLISFFAWGCWGFKAGNESSSDQSAESSVRSDKRVEKATPYFEGRVRQRWGREIWHRWLYKEDVKQLKRNKLYVLVNLKNTVRSCYNSKFNSFHLLVKVGWVKVVYL